MNKLGILIAAIILPFFYSIGCEVPLGPAENSIMVSPNSGAGNGIVSEAVAKVMEYVEWVEQNWALKDSPEGNARYLEYLENLHKVGAEQSQNLSQLFVSTESVTQNALFISASTALLATVLAPIILQVPVDDWDATCALAYQTQGGGTPKKQENGFVMNKTSTTYVSEHAILAEGTPELNKDNKVILKNAKVYKTVTGDQVYAATYHHGRWWYAIHQKDSDWVRFLPLPKDQEKRLLAEVRRINGVKDGTNMPLGRLEIE